MPTREQLIKAYGSEEAMKNQNKLNASRSRRSSRGGFSDRRLAVEAGRIGGLKSKRRKRGN